MYFIRQKKTGRVSKVVAKPFLGQNSALEELTEEEYLEAIKPKAKKKRTRKRKKAATPEVNDELTGGVADNAEDGS